MRKLSIAVWSVLALVALTITSAPARADFSQAMAAHERQDYAAAMAEFRRLAEQGHPDAQYMLGRMYASGEGVVQDYVQAHRWFNLAAANGVAEARAARAQVEDRMTAAQIAEAQQLAREFQPQAADEDFARELELDEPTLTARETVSAVQQALNERGYQAGPPDGVLGPNTRAAIEAYQADAGLPVTGTPSAELVERLGIRDAMADAGHGPIIDLGEPERTDAAASWPRLIVSDSFRDGDYTRDPSWTVASGRFFIGEGNNLRSVVEMQGEDAAARAAPDFGEVAGAVLGAVLQGALGGGQVGPIGAPEIAEIYLPERIPEAFAIELELRVLDDVGGVAIGPYVGPQREGGYRLIYIGAGEHRLELREVRGDQSSLLASHATDLGAGGARRVTWTLAPDGPMVVELDGREIMQVDSPPARESFAGFTLQNFGGDYALHRIAIYGPG